MIADVRDDQFTSDQRGNRERAMREHVESLQIDSDWPAANVNLGNLRLRQARPEEAIAAYERALSLDSRFIGAYVNLADAYRQLGREGEAEKLLRHGLALLPRAVESRHPYDLEILGTLVSMIREAGKPRNALPYARKIAEILPDDPGVKRLVAELDGAK